MEHHNRCSIRQLDVPPTNDPVGVVAIIEPAAKGLCKGERIGFLTEGNPGK